MEETIHNIPTDLREKLTFSNQQLRELEEVFLLFGKDDRGRMSIKDFQSLMGCILQADDRDDLCRHLHHAIFREGIDFIQFLRLITMTSEYTVGDLNNLSESELRSAFQEFDAEQKGYLSTADLQQIMTSLGEHPLSDEEIGEMIQVADVDGDKRVSYEEFRRMMLRF